jgi:acyl-CoA dehydrogenase
MGQRASNTATISFNETEIPVDHLIGEENKGFKIAMMTLDRTRPGVGAMATGIARAAFEFATNYSKERIQFGVPIAMHQAIQFMIADMATKVHLSRLATWNSAVLLDQGKRNTLESSHAKRFAADSAMEVATDAVQVYGGYGFIKDYPVEKLMRDAKIMQLYEGTSQIQRLVIARETLLPRRSRSPRRSRRAPVPRSARSARSARAARGTDSLSAGENGHYWKRARRQGRARRLAVAHRESDGFGSNGRNLP